MGLFDKKDNKVLDAIIFSLQMNMNNNYKDATQSDMVKLENTYEAMRKNGELNEKQMVHYAEVIDEWKEKTKGFVYKNSAGIRR